MGSHAEAQRTAQTGWWTVGTLRGTKRYYRQGLVLGYSVCAGCDGGAEMMRPDDAGPMVLDAGGAARDATVTAKDGGTPDAAGAQGRATVRELRDEDITYTHEGQGARSGDFRLENDLVTFVIAGPGAHNSYMPFGGFVVDAELRSPASTWSYDGVGEVVPQVNGCVLEPTEIAIVDDGTHGEAVRLRVTGSEKAIPYALSLLGTAPEPRGLAYAVEYSLAPGSHALELTTIVTNSSSQSLSVAVGDFALLDSDEASAVSIPHGFWLGSMDTQLTALGVANETLPYVLLLHAGDSPLGMPAGASLSRAISNDGGLWQYRLPLVELPAGETLRTTRHLVVHRDLASARAHQLQVRGVSTGVAAGTVQTMDTPVPYARVSFFAGDGSGRLLGQAITDEDGIFSAQLAPGDYQLVASCRGDGEHVETPDRTRLFAEGCRASSPRSVTVVADAEVNAALTVEPSRPLTLRVRDAAGFPIAAKFSFAAEHEESAPISIIGEREPYPDERIPFVYWTPDGEIDVAVPPGRYTVTASRGPGYSLAQQSVEVGAGSGQTLDFTLAPRLGASGWIAIDSHLHAMDSQHGNATRAERVITALSEGLDVMVNTDHDFVASYGPVVQELGAGAQITPISGVELTRLSNHHHNIWPLTPDHGLARAGAFAWWLSESATLEDAFDHYAAMGAIVFQINHGQNAFEDAGFDASTGTISKGADFSWRSNAMELQNGKRRTSREQLVPTWYALLAHGHRLSPLGASDSHGRIPEPGGARTYVRLENEPVTAENVALAVAAGRTVASTGPLAVLRTLDGTKGVGDTVQLAGGTPIALHIEVWGGEWLGVERVRLIENGLVQTEWSVSSDPAVSAPTDATDPWFRHELEVSPAADTWYAVEVTGEASLAPVYPGSEAWAHTAPLWVDVE